MIDRLMNAVSMRAGALDGMRGVLRRAIVTSFSPDRMAVQCTLQPDGVQTGWCPVLVMWVGADWGFACPPSVDDQVALMPEEGDSANFVVVGRYYSQVATPMQTPPGELWIVHKSGAYIKLLNDGTIASKGTWNHTGDFLATGDVTAGAGGSDSVTLQRHTHNNGDPDGAAETAAPTAGT